MEGFEYGAALLFWGVCFLEDHTFSFCLLCFCSLALHIRVVIKACISGKLSSDDFADVLRWEWEMFWEWERTDKKMEKVARCCQEHLQLE